MMNLTAISSVLINQPGPPQSHRSALPSPSNIKLFRVLLVPVFISDKACMPLSTVDTFWADVLMDMNPTSSEAAT
jgi:hypothetical protein